MVEKEAKAIGSSVRPEDPEWFKRLCQEADMNQARVNVLDSIPPANQDKLYGHPTVNELPSRGNPGGA